MDSFLGDNMKKILKVIMTFVLTVIGLLFLLLIRLGIGLSIEKQKIRRYQTLYQLGMEKIIIWKYFLKNNFILFVF